MFRHAGINKMQVRYRKYREPVTGYGLRLEFVICRVVLCDCTEDSQVSGRLDRTTTETTVGVSQAGPGCLVTIIWFVLVG